MKENGKIMVFGAGTMGAGIALVLAHNYYEVILKDLSDKALDNAKSDIEKGYKQACFIKREYKQNNIQQILERIHFTTEYAGIEEADIIIENIIEDIDEKIKLYSEINGTYKENCLFLLNTSCISITRLASYLKEPANAIGVHLMNPVYLKDLVEVIKGYHTSKETIEKTITFLKKIEKTSVVVNDSPGFVSNRVSHTFMNEAAFLVYEKVAAPKDIDMIFKKGYGHSMGPLETADLIGLDTVVNSLNVLYQSYLDSKFRCCPLLIKMVDAGLLGRKTGKGFYDYSI